MNFKFIKTAFLVFVLISIHLVAQNDSDVDSELSAMQASNIQFYTPSKLLNKGQWDIKFFNNLYTEIVAKFNGVKRAKARETYFTSTLDIFTGVTDNNRVNIGLLLAYRSNTINGKKATAVFNFADDVRSRNSLSSFAPALKWQPIENTDKFSIQSAFHIPLVVEEKDINRVFLDQTAYMFQNRFLYDYTLPSGNWQLFTELNTEYNFGEDASFANNTFVIAPGFFISYFPHNKSTVFVSVQHYQRFGDFTQDFTTMGFGGKYQLTEVLNLEVLYNKFVRGNDTGLGQSFNMGLRALF
ncbi:MULTISPECIES: hypothetical protein [unclassified Polaribacter]|uniref:hypothetical protein n=1 Tax=unclassified Polaribacter TaxID=196858 RepID=UPI0011BF6D65|nr:MULTISPECIES: hypothetical protein [unclassified Polaribacter]TXD54034.1 hypothetical protein ES043_01915 [Polaribacter sp. IC063]TXD62550.1 hypothetical protein ES044_00945 [Polaribacter sp. IC066]